MYAQRSVFTQRQAIKACRQSLFIQAMSAFMDTAPGHIAEIIFINTGSEAYILAAEIGGERMFRNILPPAVEIKAQLFNQFHSKLPLLFFWIMAQQKSFFHLWAGSYFANQIPSRELQAMQNFIQQSSRGPPFILIKQRIIRMVFIPQITGFLFFELQQTWLRCGSKTKMHFLFLRLPMPESCWTLLH